MKTIDMTHSQTLADFAQAYPTLSPIVKSILAGQVPSFKGIDLVSVMGEDIKAFAQALYQYLGMEQLLGWQQPSVLCQLDPYLPITKLDAQLILSSYCVPISLRRKAFRILEDSMTFELFEQFPSYHQYNIINWAKDPWLIMEGVCHYLSKATSLKTLNNYYTKSIYVELLEYIVGSGRFYDQVPLHFLKDLTKVRQQVAYWAAVNENKTLCRQLEKFDHMTKVYLLLGGYSSGALFQDPKADWLRSVDRTMTKHPDWSPAQVAQHLGLSVVWENLSQTLRV